MAHIQIASDNFTRANGAIGANWATSSGIGWNITSNQADSGTNNPGTVYWVGAGSFVSSQYSIVTLGVSDVNPLLTYYGCDLNDNGSSRYELRVNSTGSYFIVKQPGTNVLASGAAPTLVAGDTIEFDNVGGVLTAYHNGTQFGTATDVSPIITGVPGMFGGYSGQDAFYSNWSGGIFGSSGGGGTGSPPFGWMNMQHDFANKHGEA
jgi:hypothetical protein